MGIRESPTLRNERISAPPRPTPGSLETLTGTQHTAADASSNHSLNIPSPHALPLDSRMWLPKQREFGDGGFVRSNEKSRAWGFLTSCEAELQELMKQIDIMVAHKKSEWEGRTHALETCLKIREQELKTLRSQLDVKHKEVGTLHQQVEEHEKIKQEMTMEYKQELKKLHEELGRLKRSYEKLQKKQMREFRGNTKNHWEDQSEIERLTAKIEEFRQKSLDWEKQRLIYQQQVSSLEAQRKALTEQSEIIQALQEEKTELRAALQSQENLIHEERMLKEKLQEKVKAADAQHAVEALSLESVSATCKQLSQELMEKYEEVKRMEAHNNEYRAEIKKLKEQILQAEQSYSSALEGMKLEISHLTQELHQRDITIASTKGSSSDMEKRLKAEMQRAEEKAVEHKEILDQLESLKLENRRLNEMVMKLELGLHECSLPVSPLGSIATRFLEEEELRSHHILQRLDAHIEELKRESEKTVRQFTALK
ncbi:centrosomal protein of 63 kDa isoform X3 [Aotus nancymaae]|uniref:centrosomal protein of 63 kDa isoform X3 n=1 Tax=Aotus nancymaae TaxID=37293 RepID=UPI0030FE763E